MLATRKDPRVLGYLGRALSLELSAVQIYSTQARLVSSWGLSEPAARFRAESKEELSHADRIIERMLEVGVAPGSSQLRPAIIGRNLAEILQANAVFEKELIDLYRQAVDYCARAGYDEDRTFFEGLAEDEQLHLEELLIWLKRVHAGTGSSRR